MKIKRYSKRMNNALYAQIVHSFGVPREVLRDPAPEFVAADILVIEPSAKRNCYTLVTFGMGARRMNVPRELRQPRLARAELVLHLPHDWNFGGDVANSWPAKLLFGVAHMPFREKNYLGWGHSAEIDEAYVRSDLFVGAMLATPSLNGETGAIDCGRTRVNFYEVVPLNIEKTGDGVVETDLSSQDEMRAVSPMLDVCRIDVCDRDFSAPLDDGRWHIWKIHYKRLKTDEQNAYNHIAAYFEWAYERGFVRPPYAVLEGDFRTHVVEKLGGRLLSLYFEGEGAAFTEAYYSEHSDGYMGDVNALAVQTFGENRNKKLYRSEGYLFLPYDKAYRARIMAILDKRFEEWIKEQS